MGIQKRDIMDPPYVETIVASDEQWTCWFGLYKIEKESKLNEGGTVGRDRKVRLEDSIIQKASAMAKRRMDKCEEQFALFKAQAHEGVPETGTTVYNWQMNQMSNVRTGLGYKIEKESE
jgi:hypothetical protein